MKLNIENSLWLKFCPHCCSTTDTMNDRILKMKAKREVWIQTLTLTRLQIKGRGQVTSNIISIYVAFMSALWDEMRFNVQEWPKFSYTDAYNLI